MQGHFNGEHEPRSKPKRVTVEEQLQHAADYEAWKAAGDRDGALGDPSKVHGCKRTSILFTLPYWKVSYLIVRTVVIPCHCHLYSMTYVEMKQ
jgi:hypothetical protein